jgi:CBS domain-containing membrane protein
MRYIPPISGIMSTNMIALNRDDDLETAEMLFKKHKIRHIPVVHEDSIIGMLSYTDLLRISFADAFNENEDGVDTVVYNMFTIEQVMAKKIVSVNSETTIKEVGELLSKNEFQVQHTSSTSRLTEPLIYFHRRYLVGYDCENL